jgi:ABC-type Mn2+/Zn2+ transport system ATPase subunit
MVYKGLRFLPNKMWQITALIDNIEALAHFEGEPKGTRKEIKNIVNLIAQKDPDLSEAEIKDFVSVYSSMLYTANNQVRANYVNRVIRKATSRKVLPANNSVFENVAFGLKGLSKAARVDRVRELLKLVSMESFENRSATELSGGQKHRVALARALAPEPELILLDEPFTGVDVQTEDQITALLRDLRAEGRVMLVSTHNLGSVPEFCDRVILVKGTVLAHGPTETTFTHANLERTFGGVLRRFTLGGDTLHDDADARAVTILTDDERPFVHYGDKLQKAERLE